MKWKELILDLIDHGIQQKEIAIDCRVSESTVCQWKKGNRVPVWNSGDLLIKLHQDRVKK